jgi:hypothetical protein
MNNSRSINIYNKSARVISFIFQPLLMPLYGMVIIFSAPTLYSYIPFAIKKLLLLIVLVNNVLLPLSILPFFIRWNIISSWTISERRERIIPLILTTILYSVTTIIIFRFPVSAFLKSYILAASFLSLLVTVINFWWKISLHSVGAGALIAIVLILSFKMYTPLLWYLIPSIIVGGLLLTSRLQLNLHNPQQVWFGFLTGFFGLSFIMIVFQ